MGCCYSLNTQNINLNNFENDIKYFILKFPHGKEYIIYSNNKFIKYTDINEWLDNLYKNNNWINWIIYNDEIPYIYYKDFNIKIITKGHSKGILTYNKNRIGWLCHSIPKFPIKFDNNGISEINKSELIYGQSFQYIEIDFNQEILNNIIKQLEIMQVNIYINNSNIVLKKNKNISINKIKITNKIYHIAKSPKYHIDIYNQYLIKEYKYNWKIESWKRGYNIENTNKNIYDIKKLQFENTIWFENQDHSKWCVSNKNYYCISDLNRMTTQYQRGGGIFICEDINLSLQLNKLIII
jgi:hypothetical protein